MVYSQGGLFVCYAQHESFLVIASYKWLKSNDVDGLGCSSIHPHNERNHEQLSCANRFVFLAADDFSGKHESAVSIIQYNNHIQHFQGLVVNKNTSDLQHL